MLIYEYKLDGTKAQYASLCYQSQLQQYGIVASMSRKGDCYDNALAETFFATLKAECVDPQSYTTRLEARQDIFLYIEQFYNRKRLHSALGYVSPLSFEEGGQREKSKEIDKERCICYLSL